MASRVSRIMQHVGGGCGGDCGSRWIRRGRGQSRLMNNAARQQAAGWGVAGAPPALEPGRGGRGSDGRKMAALKEARSYGLSCGRVSDGSKVSVFHVKLTDSALRAFESYRASQVSDTGLGAAVGDVGAQVGLSRPSPWRPCLGARGPASEVLIAGSWAGGARGGHLSGSERGEPRRGETTLAGGPGRPRGPNSRAWSGGRLCRHLEASGAFPDLPGTWAGTRFFT